MKSENSTIPNQVVTEQTEILLVTSPLYQVFSQNPDLFTQLKEQLKKPHAVLVSTNREDMEN